MKQSKEITREQIHSGLSGLREDSRWSDVCDFRFCNSRTVIVPPYQKYPNISTGLHTLVKGCNNNHYAIGSKCSYHLRDRMGILDFSPLWELKHKFVGDRSARDSKDYQLVLKGRYTGETPKRLTVTLVDDTNHIPIVEPIVSVEEVPAYVCPGNRQDTLGFINLDFEEGLEDQTGFLPAIDIPGWDSQNYSVIEIAPLIAVQGGPFSGGRYLEVNSHGPDTISQTAYADITEAKYVTMTFRKRNRQGSADRFFVRLEFVDTGLVIFEEEYIESNLDWEDTVIYRRPVPRYAGQVKMTMESNTSGSASVHIDYITINLES